MRRFYVLLTTALLLAVTSTAAADHPCLEFVDVPEAGPGYMPLPARRTMEADADPEMARLRYRRIEYALQLKKLDHQIQLATAEIRSLDRQIAVYESISRPRYSDPFLVTLESAKLRRLAVELRLKELRLEKLQLIRAN